MYVMYFSTILDCTFKSSLALGRSIWGVFLHFLSHPEFICIPLSCLYLIWPCADYWCSSSRTGQCFQGRSGFRILVSPFRMCLGFFYLCIYWMCCPLFWRRNWRRSCLECMRLRTPMRFSCSSSVPISEVGSQLGLVWFMIPLRTRRSMSPSTGLSG